MTTHELTGIRPVPLASYLAGLGLVRLLGEQVDPDATAAWQDNCLVINTTVDDLASWLVDEYVPTPVLSPWNEGSGFGVKDVKPRDRLTRLSESPSPRLAPFREALTVAAAVGDRYRRRLTEGVKKDVAKEGAVREFRNQAPDSLLPWIDATVVLGQEAYFPPLLGTGGNDGRLDFSTTYHERLLEVLDPSEARHTRSRTLASDLLTGLQREQLVSEPIGQFDPVGAGGKNSSPFGDAGSLVNPWAFVLLVEGALLFAASVARRHLHGARRAAVPFTVISSPDGSASGADDEKSRGEVWAPVWRRPFTYREIRQLFAEARAAWRGRPAQRAVDFYAATRTLGVVRGVDEFQRYGLHQRNGLAFVAVPVDRVTVGEKPAVRLAAELEDWVSRVRRGEATTAVGRAVRRFDAAHLAFARDGEVSQLRELLAALTEVELAAGRSERTKEHMDVRRPPDASNFLHAFESLESPELRLAVGLASCRTETRPGGTPPRTLRHLLLAVDPDNSWRSTPVVPGFGMRPLTQVLADVMIWRSRTASDEATVSDGAAAGYRGVPSFRGIGVPAADLHAFAAGHIDYELLDRWLRACLALRWDRAHKRWRQVPTHRLVPTLAVLRPLANGLPVDGTDPQSPRLALGPDWAARLAAGQIRAVHDDALRRLRQAGWEAVPAPPHADINGHAVAAALVPPCRDSRTDLKRVAIRLSSHDEPHVENIDDAAPAVAPLT